MVSPRLFVACALLLLATAVFGLEKVDRKKEPLVTTTDLTHGQNDKDATTTLSKAVGEIGGGSGGLSPNNAHTGLRFAKAETKGKQKFVGAMMAGAAMGAMAGGMMGGMMGMMAVPPGYANPYPRYKYGHGYMFNSQWQMNMMSSPRASQGLGSYIGPCVGQC